MNFVKRLALAILLGFFLGVVVASALTPSFLEWYNRPGASQAMCNCQELTRASIESLLHAQMLGAGIGIAICVAGAILMGGRKAPPSVEVNR